jgi:Skp family chaperone for outer membrane proteins
MDKVREFQSKAAECREQAAKADTESVREHYSNLARMWDKLAEERLKFFVKLPAAESADDGSSQEP